MKKNNWIKFFASFRDDAKVRILRAHGGADMVLIYIYLLCLAEERDNCGVIRLTDDIPFTDEILATVLDFGVDKITEALQLFVKLDMIEYMDDGGIFMSDWARYRYEWEEDQLWQIKKM